MTPVSTYLPLLELERRVGEIEILVHPTQDNALGGLIADVFFADEGGTFHAVNDERAKYWLARIKSEQPDVWREIEAASWDTDDDVDEPPDCYFDEGVYAR